MVHGPVVAEFQTKRLEQTSQTGFGNQAGLEIDDGEFVEKRHGLRWGFEGLSFQARQLLKLLKLFLLEFSQPFSDAPEENPLGIVVQLEASNLTGLPRLYAVNSLSESSHARSLLPQGFVVQDPLVGLEQLLPVGAEDAITEETKDPRE